MNIHWSFHSESGLRGKWWYVWREHRMESSIWIKNKTNVCWINFIDDIMHSVLNLMGSKCSKAAIKIAKPPSLETLPWKLAFYWAKNSVSLWSQKYTGSTSLGQRESNLWKISKLIFSKMDLRPKALFWLALPQASNILFPCETSDTLPPLPKLLFPPCLTNATPYF